MSDRRAHGVRRIRPFVKGARNATVRTPAQGYDYFHPQHRRARGGTLSRSRGRCQGCGYWPAVHAHHWLQRYLPPWATTSDHLTALCRPCHRVMTLVRRFLSVGGDAGRFPRHR